MPLRDSCSLTSKKKRGGGSLDLRAIRQKEVKEFTSKSDPINSPYPVVLSIIIIMNLKLYKNLKI